MNTRLDNTKHTSLNESIAYVNSPQRELDEAVEYALALEDLLLALCEELDIDPDALVEDLQTPERAKEMRQKIRTARDNKSWARHERDEYHHLAGIAGTYSKEGERDHKGSARNAERRLATADRQQKALSAQDAKEKASKKLYGRGGKVVSAAKPAGAARKR